MKQYNFQQNLKKKKPSGFSEKYISEIKNVSDDFKSKRDQRKTESMDLLTGQQKLKHREKNGMNKTEYMRRETQSNCLIFMDL